MNEILLKEKITESQKSLRRGDKVRYYCDGVAKHEGVVIDLTTTFARIFRPKRNIEDTSGDISFDSAEWFPIQNAFGGIIKT